MKRAVVLLSGGLDSATTAAIAKERGFGVHALSVQYGQRHDVELRAAARVAQSLDMCQHLVITVDLRQFGGSALTGPIDVPKRLAPPPAGEIPVTYVPARNTVFLALALAYAETISSNDIFIGANAIDYSGYPDCRPEFLAAFERVAVLGTKMGVEGSAVCIHAPLLSMSKADIIREGHRLGVDFSLTHSCYDPNPEGLACGRCDSCHLRRRGFQAARIADPAAYVSRPSE